VDGRCDQHLFEAAEDLCRECGREYCDECLVYPFGPKKPPLCRQCAIAAAGIRKHAKRPKVKTSRELKRQVKERKKAAKKATPEPVLEVRPMDSGPALEEEHDEGFDRRAIVNVPETAAVDWTAPFEPGNFAPQR
jgi:hypothetical protein